MQTTVYSDSSGRIRVYVNAKTYDTDDSSAIPQTDKPQSFRVASKDNVSGNIVSYTSFSKAITWSTGLQHNFGQTVKQHMIGGLDSSTLAIA